MASVWFRDSMTKTRVCFLSTILATSRVVSLVMAFPGFVSLQHPEQKQGWLWEGLSEDGGVFFPWPQQTFWWSEVCHHTYPWTNPRLALTTNIHHCGNTCRVSWLGQIIETHPWSWGRTNTSLSENKNKHCLFAMEWIGEVIDREWREIIRMSFILSWYWTWPWEFQGKCILSDTIFIN